MPGSQGAAVQRGVVQARRVVAGWVDALQRGADFEHFVDGFAEAVEVVFYQTCREKRIRVKT